MKPAQNGRHRLAVRAEPPFDLSSGMVERAETFENTVDIGLIHVTKKDALPQVAFLVVDRVVHQPLALQRNAAALGVFRRQRFAVIRVEIGIGAVIGPGGGRGCCQEKDQRNCACVRYHERSSYRGRSGTRDCSFKPRIFPLMTKVMLRRGMFTVIGLASQTQTPGRKHAY